MKKLLLIALVVSGIAFATAPKTEAGTYFSVGIGFPIGFGYYGGCYPGYYSGYYGGYGYYPYTGYYRAYPSTGWDIDIMAIDIMAIVTAGHTIGITVAGFITPAAYRYR